MYKYSRITEKQKEYIRNIMHDKLGYCLVEDVQNMSRYRANELITSLLDEKIEILVQQGVLKKSTDTLTVDSYSLVSEIKAIEVQDDPNRIRYAE